MNDAFNVCGDAIPDRDRVAACLAHNIKRISAPCRTVMLRYPKPAATATSKPPAKLSKRPLDIKRSRTGARS